MIISPIEEAQHGTATFGDEATNFTFGAPPEVSKHLWLVVWTYPSEKYESVSLDDEKLPTEWEFIKY